MVAMLAAGYLAPALLGLLAAYLLGDGRGVGLLWLLVLLLAGLLVWVRNGYGLLVVLLGGAPCSPSPGGGRRPRSRSRPTSWPGCSCSPPRVRRSSCSAAGAVDRSDPDQAGGAHPRPGGAVDAPPARRELRG